MRGKARAPPYLIVGADGAAVTAVCIPGGLALDDLPPAWPAWGTILFAFLGIPGSYTVAEPALLWIARSCCSRSASASP